MRAAFKARLAGPGVVLVVLVLLSAICLPIWLRPGLRYRPVVGFITQPTFELLSFYQAVDRVSGQHPVQPSYVPYPLSAATGSGPQVLLVSSLENPPNPCAVSELALTSGMPPLGSVRINVSYTNQANTVVTYPIQACTLLVDKFTQQYWLVGYYSDTTNSIVVSNNYGYPWVTPALSSMAIAFFNLGTNPLTSLSFSFGSVTTKTLSPAVVLICQLANRANCPNTLVPSIQPGAGLLYYPLTFPWGTLQLTRGVMAAGGFLGVIACAFSASELANIGNTNNPFNPCSSTSNSTDTYYVVFLNPNNNTIVPTPLNQWLYPYCPTQSPNCLQGGILAASTWLELDPAIAGGVLLPCSGLFTPTSQQTSVGVKATCVPITQTGTLAGQLLPAGQTNVGLRSGGQGLTYAYMPGRSNILLDTVGNPVLLSITAFTDTPFGTVSFDSTQHLTYPSSTQTFGTSSTLNNQWLDTYVQPNDVSPFQFFSSPSTWIVSYNNSCYFVDLFEAANFGGPGYDLATLLNQTMAEIPTVGTVPLSSCPGSGQAFTISTSSNYQQVLNISTGPAGLVNGPPLVIDSSTSSSQLNYNDPLIVLYSENDYVTSVNNQNNISNAGGFWSVWQLVSGNGIMNNSSNQITNLSGFIAPQNGATLSMSTPTSVTWSATLTGTDGYLATNTALGVVDPTGTGVGWNITLTPTGPFINPNINQLYVTGTTGTTNVIVPSISSSPPTAQCAPGSSCRLPANNLTYPVAVSLSATATAYRIENASPGSGMGALNVGLGWWLFVPANTKAGTSTTTFVINISSGP